MSDSDRGAFLALPHTPRVIEAQGYVVREGDLATHSCLLRSGFLYRHKIVADGARQILSIHLAGDIVDLQNSLLRVADHNVQALTRCEIANIPREAVRRIAFERPAIGEALWLDTLVDGSIFANGSQTSGGAMHELDWRIFSVSSRCDCAARDWWRTMNSNTNCR